MALARGQLDERFGEHEPKSRVRTVAIDFETYCDLNLKEVGLDLYSAHPSCEVLMCAYSFDEGRTVHHWDSTVDPEMPDDLYDALRDKKVQLWAFNAQFERTILNRVLDIWPSMSRWRCTMVLSYFHSFVGNLDRVVVQCGLDQDKQKLATGKKLMKMFCEPQKVTKTNSHKRFTRETHPVEWQMFVEYNCQDVVAESAVKRRLDRPQYSIPDREWKFYHLDQRINDRGLPIDRTFVGNAMRMAAIRKAELTAEKAALTGLSNPNSGPQFLPWVRKRGYPYADLKKDSVKKVLAAHKLIERGELQPGKNVLYPVLTDECVEGLLLHQQTSRTSTTKYAALAKAVGDDGRMRFVFQFAGASRTARFAGRRFQPQNLTTMRDIENPKVLSQLTDLIRANDYESLELYRKEPLDALAGLVRSSVRAKKGKKLVVCDLSSIESVVIGWVSGCERLLNVFRDGKDAYKDFATELFKVTYDEVTKDMRKMAKPATLGAGYRLGGGDFNAEGKRTGLWGYAENMGIDMTRKEAHKSVAIFRRVYKEIVNTWYALEDAIMRTIRTQAETKVGPIRFSYAKPYLICHLPSGRNIYYLKPRVERRPFQYRDKDTGKLVRTMKDTISYMGKAQNGSAWVRVYSHGGKVIENVVQAIARDILREGLMIADELGFNIIGHVHDEIICEEAANDNDHALDELRVAMIRKIRWAQRMPLNAAGHESVIYFKG